MKILSTKNVFTSRNFKVDHVTIERDGKTFGKDIIEATPVALILPYTEEGDIYIASEYRDAFGKVVLNCIGGKIDSKDDPLVDAKRELQEEAGLEATDWKHVITWETAWNVKKKLFIFFAKGLKTVKQHLEEDEKIDIIKLQLSVALDKIENGEIAGAADVAVILLFDRLWKEGRL
jgi:ADP-ribose diphosphatase